jgi:hypothetical protein
MEDGTYLYSQYIEKNGFSTSRWTWARSKKFNSSFTLLGSFTTIIAFHYYSQVQQGQLNKLCKSGWPSRPYANAFTVEFTVRAVQHQSPLQWPTVRAVGNNNRPY